MIGRKRYSFWRRGIDESEGCLKKLETLWIEDCENLEVQVLVGGDQVHNWKKKSSLVQVGDPLPKLQVLYVLRNMHLVEVNILWKKNPDVKKLILGTYKRLERLQNLDKLGAYLPTKGFSLSQQAYRILTFVTTKQLEASRLEHFAGSA